MSRTKTWKPIPVFVQLHNADPGSDGTRNVIPIGKVVGEALATFDAYGIDRLKVRATWHGVTVGKWVNRRMTNGATHFTVWGGEDGQRLLASQPLNPDVPPGGYGCFDGKFTVDSISPLDPRHVD